MDQFISFIVNGGWTILNMAFLAFIIFILVMLARFLWRANKRHS